MRTKDKSHYLLIRALTYPLSWMPYSWIRLLGNSLGKIGFYFLKSYRKRALSNLALASRLSLTKKELFTLAKKSFQNLAINCLEYPKLAKEKNLAKVIQCENPEIANEIYEKGKGIIFFCGHQSNWEVLFLDGTSRMKGVAIGKPIKNKRLYQWVLSIRERNGGRIISPKNAVKEGLKALRKGVFLGIVGDQGMPDSGYSFPFLGRRAWTSTAPALLSYKTNSPIIFAETRRVKGGYKIRYSNPIWPNLNEELEKEIPRMMDLSLTLLQESIVTYPGEWLWQHNRWKQQNTHSLYKRFRQDCISIILPERGFHQFLPILSTLKEIYPLAFLFLFVPKKYQNKSFIKVDETLFYEKIEETLVDDFRVKMVFNFTDYEKIHTHYAKLSAFEILTWEMIVELAKEHAKPHHSPSDLLKRALCKPGSIWKREE